MGTRHLTVFKEQGDFETSKEIVVMYGQFDGYLTGYGNDLKNFLNGFYIVNGYTIEDEKPEVKAANGMGCLAAQTIAHFKKEGIKSSFHLMPAGQREAWEEYIYTIYCPSELSDWTKRVKLEPYIRVWQKYTKRTFYDGPVSKFDPNIKEEE